MSAILLNSTQIAQLFQNHNAAIMAFLVNRVTCLETAQDLSQETYLRLLNKGEISHDENIIGYLFRIADRLAINSLPRKYQQVFLLRKIDELSY